MDTPLRERVREQVRAEVLEGLLEPGQQIRVAPLAEQLSVSMTPAREALTQLETEGWIVLRPNRGFFVAPITLEEAGEIYPLLGGLEGLAVELQGPIPEETLSELESINAELRKVGGDPRVSLQCDRCWHETLVSGCTNGMLREQLATIRQRAERYERAYMRHSGRIPSSTRDHRLIVEALRERSDRMPDLLRRHWARSLDFVGEWLTEWVS